MKNKKLKISLIAILCIVIVIVCAALFVFRGEAATMLGVKGDGEKGIYTVDYKANYKLDELLEQGGAASEEELVQYILKVMLKGLPIDIPYSIPELGCSTFNAETPEGGFIFGRNFDNQVTDLAVIKTNPKDGYKSVSVTNLSFLGYNQNYKPDKLFDRIFTLATPYFPLDGVNEKGLAVGVLQLQAPVTAQDNGKVNVGTTLAIRVLLDKAATVKEAVELLSSFDMFASAKGCYHFHIADASGDAVVVSYVNDEMVVTKETEPYLAATNFYLHEVPFEYEAQGMDRYDKLIEVLSKKKGILSLEEGMELLSYASLDDTEPDEKGRVYSTQWSSMYDLTEPKLILSADKDYENSYVYEVE